MLQHSKSKKSYFHGTSSLVLALFPHSKHSLMSPRHLLEKHSLAPLGGEINGGGLQTLGEGVGDTSFGDISWLNCIIDKYAKAEVMGWHGKPTRVKVDNASLADHAKYAKEELFSNLLHLLLHYVELKQTGEYDPSQLPEGWEDALLKDLNEVIQFYYLILIVGETIFPKHDLLMSLPVAERKKIVSAIFNELSDKNLINKINQSGLDLRAVYLHPKKSDLQAVLAILEIPANAMVNEGWYAHGKLVPAKVAETQLFSLDEPQTVLDFYKLKGDEKWSIRTTSTSASDYATGLMTKYARDYQFSDSLANVLSGTYPINFIKAMKPKVSAHIRHLEHLGEIFERVRRKAYTPINKPQKPYPLIFVVDDADLLYQHKSGELRSKQPLQLGKDITLLATDTPTHAIELKQWLTKNNLEQICVTLFSDLRKLRTYQITPKTYDLSTLKSLADKSMSQPVPRQVDVEPSPSPRYNLANYCCQLILGSCTLALIYMMYTMQNAEQVDQPELSCNSGLTF